MQLHFISNEVTLQEMPNSKHLEDTSVIHILEIEVVYEKMYTYT